MKFMDVFLPQCHQAKKKGPELNDIQWNETATSDSMIVTQLFLLLLKKAVYLPQPLKMCYDLGAGQTQRDRDSEGEREREV